MSGFTLAGLLRLRQVQEDRAAAELGRAERERTRSQDRARSTSERLAASYVPFAADDRTWLAAAASRLTLGALLEEDEQRLTVALEDADERREQWTQARRAERSVERLEEHHEERQRATELRAEQQALDEIAGRKQPTVNREEER